MTDLSLSPRAAQQIVAKGGILRVRVLAGGCSGLRYVFSIEPQSTPEDIVFHSHDACVVTDALSLHFIQGSTVDYQEELMVSQFVVINPKADHACGCGESFSVS